MKLRILALLLLLPSCNKLDRLLGQSSSPSFGNNEALTIVIAGQSNGVSDTANIFPAANKVYSESGRVKVTHSFSGETVDSIPTKEKPCRYSAAWIHLGDQIAMLRNRDVHIINVSHGNTSTRNWQQYIPELESVVKHYNPDMVIWVQGESDRMEQIPYEESLSNMRKIIECSRKKNPYLKWFVALDGFVPDNDFNLWESEGVRRAQRQLIREGCVKEGPDIDAMRFRNWNWFEPVSGNPYPGAEFIYDGLEEHANSWAKIILSYV